jgi:hypothetical protein
MAEDRKGREFGNAAEACTHAVRRVPGLLRKYLRLETNTYLATEVSDGERRRCVIRGKVTFEKE